MCVYESYMSHTGMRTQLDNIHSQTRGKKKQEMTPKGDIHDVHELRHAKAHLLASNTQDGMAILALTTR